MTLDEIVVKLRAGRGVAHKSDIAPMRATIVPLYPMATAICS